MNKSNKGKQGTRGEKQIIDENKQTISNYFKIFSISNGAYLGLQYLFFWESFTTLYISLYALSFLVSFLGYYFINYMGKPILDERGVVIGAGSDLNMQGHISEYAKDAVLFISLIYIVTLFHRYCWFFLLVAPIYLFVLLWKNFLGPWFFAPAPTEEENQQDNKKKPKEKRRIIRN